jgi:hypothetical protein
MYALVPFLFVSASLLPAAPVPRDAGKQLYFPTQVGTKLLYDFGPGHGPYLEVVTESEEKDGRYRVTVKTTNPEEKDDEDASRTLYEVSHEGVFLLASCLERGPDRITREPPYCLLKLPHKEGEKWGGNLKDKEPEMVAGKVETVKVPAGTFEAMRVDQGPKSTYWYAAGLGCVKRQINDSLLELRSYTLPKK